MEVKLYGKQDADSALLVAVTKYAEEQGASRLTVSMHQRAPLDSKPCRRPGSLTYDFQLDDQPWLAAKQLANGKVFVPFRGA